MMKIQNSYSYNSRARRSRMPIVLIILILALIGAIYAMWSAGGETPQVKVEKVIPADKLGQ